MAVEDLGSFTEIDPNGHISFPVSTKCQVDNFTRGETAYAYKSYGTGHFSSDFEHLLTIYINSMAYYTHWYPWCLWETKEGDNNADVYNNGSAGHEGLVIEIKRATGGRQLRVNELRDGEIYAYAGNWVNITTGITYYLKIVKDETAGTFKCHVYTDAERTQEIAGSPSTLTLQTPYVDYEFLYCCSSHSTGTELYNTDAYCEDLDLQEVTYTISGVTRDANGNPLGGCTVQLFRASDKAFIEEKTSDGSGDYSFTVYDNTTEYFVRAYKDGTSTVFGTTDDDLTGS